MSVVSMRVSSYSICVCVCFSSPITQLLQVTHTHTVNDSLIGSRYRRKKIGGTTEEERWCLGSLSENESLKKKARKKDVVINVFSALSSSTVYSLLSLSSLPLCFFFSWNFFYIFWRPKISRKIKKRRKKKQSLQTVIFPVLTLSSSYFFGIF